MNSPLVQALKSEAMKQLRAIDAFFQNPAANNAKAEFDALMKVLAAGTNQRKSENGTTTQHLKAFELGLIPKQHGAQLWTGLTGMNEKGIASSSVVETTTSIIPQENEPSGITMPNGPTRRSKKKK